MCVVSNIGGWGQHQYPWYDRPWQTIPNIPVDPIQEQKKLEDFMELIRKGKEVDKRTHQPDCEAPDKAEFLKNIEQRLAAIEEALGLKPREPEDLSKRSTEDLLEEIQRRIGSKVTVVDAR